MKDKPTEDEVKTDLKHDTMEFAAPTDGDDVLDKDDMLFEEEEIDAKELEALDDDPDKEAAALAATEADLQGDADILPEEDWTDDLPDKIEPETKEDNEYIR